jgi:hypothetical protein
MTFIESSPQEKAITAPATNTLDNVVFAQHKPDLYVHNDVHFTHLLKTQLN